MLVPVVLDAGAPAELEPPPAGLVVVVGSGEDVVGVVVGGVVDVFGGGVTDVCTGGGLSPVSLRGGGGGGEACVTTVVVVLPSGLTDTTVVGALEDEGLDVVGAPLEVAGSLDDGLVGSVCTPAGTVPWPPGPPVPPAVLAGTGPASSATAANAVATTSPATPSTTYPVRFGLLLLGGAVSILVTRELESDPSGRGIRGSLGISGRRGAEVVYRAKPRRGTDLGGEAITGSWVFAQVVALIRYCARSVDPEGRNGVSEEETHTRLTAWVRGRVQGVGFRWWTRSRALELGLVGSASNLADGRVEVIAEGSRDHCQRLLAALRSGESPGSVEHVAERWSDPKGGLSGFVER